MSVLSSRGLEDVEGLREPFAPGAAAELAQDVPGLERGRWRAGSAVGVRDRLADFCAAGLFFLRYGLITGFPGAGVALVLGTTSHSPGPGGGPVVAATVAEDFLHYPPVPGAVVHFDGLGMEPKSSWPWPLTYR
jgi:hypothetical protein